MDTVITCPNCKTEIPLSDAFKHEIEAGVLATERARHQRELDAAVKSAEGAAAKKATEEAARREAALRAEATEEKDRNAALLKQLEELSGDLRALRRKDEERDLAYKQKLADEEERIRSDAKKSAAADVALQLDKKDREIATAREEAQKQERLLKDQLVAAEDRARADARKSADDEYALKLREKDKQLADAMQKVKEAEAKMQQGSQQAQGEVLELELEEILREAFRDDEISEIKKGQRGADTLQKVIDRKARHCGSILWESKNAQWSDTWLAKLRADQREAKAQIAVLVAVHPPADIDTFAHRDGIWIVRRRYARDLASLLRHTLTAVYAERANQAGKDEKMEILYGYLTSVEFQHRIQAIVEGFTYLFNDVEREKRWFETKWARQEKEIRKIIDSTQGMYGDLQAVTGRSLPTIAALETPDAILPEPAGANVVAGAH
jgi:hypothetical protein